MSILIESSSEDDILNAKIIKEKFMIKISAFLITLMFFFTLPSYANPEECMQEAEANWADIAEGEPMPDEEREFWESECSGDTDEMPDFDEG